MRMFFLFSLSRNNMFYLNVITKNASDFSINVFPLLVFNCEQF